MKKQIDPVYIDNVSRELAAIVRDHFGGNATKAAKALGMSQPHLSHLIASTTNRGPGLSVLILMRGYLQKSIDDLLGLPPLPNTELVRTVMAVIEGEAKKRESGRVLSQEPRKPVPLRGAGRLRMKGRGPR